MCSSDLRLRKHLKTALGSYETLHFYAVGEYGPVHFRPHYHILLFTNSKEVSKVLRLCHDKSLKLGRSDFQIARGGASSYVASYVNSLASAPLLYRSCRAFKPRQRASLGFFEKGEVLEESEDVYYAIEKKIDSVINGRVYNFNGISVKSTPPMSYIRTLLPRFQVLAARMLLRLLEFFELYTQRQKELQNMDSSTINRTQF